MPPALRNASSAQSQPPVLLGIEAGATRTVALAVFADGRPPLRLEAGPANVHLRTDAQLVRLFRSLARALPAPSVLGIGMAGARTPADRRRIREAAAQVWPGIPCCATSDLETGLLADDFEPANARAAANPEPRVLVLSGTGSCCFGLAPNGATVRVGGWGHILGDKSSGYDIALQALQAVVHAYDCTGRWPALGQRCLRALALNEPEDLVGWAQRAGKHEMAALAVEVFAAAQQRDQLAAAVLNAAARRLAAHAAACARRLVRPGTPVRFILAGSVLCKQPGFAARVRRELQRLWRPAIVQPLKRESVWGAVALARREWLSQTTSSPGLRQRRSDALEPAPLWTTTSEASAPLGPLPLAESSPTEQRNPRSMNLDKLSLREAITLMLEEDQRIPPALLAERAAIERALRLIIRSFRRGGRLFYVGAGTSGRLGVLDASECPPTFGTPPDQVQGIIAGGQTALWSSLEGAEDDAEAGARALEGRGVSRRDTVVGIAASGRTPFVWGALREARRRGAATVLLCFNPRVAVPREARPQVIIAPDVGPEILTGSTRLKAGTATKLVLNLFTTLSMVRLGRVQSNLMIAVKATNTKLRDRATRITQALTRADYATARAALQQTGWQIKAACARLRRRRRAQGRRSS